MVISIWLGGNERGITINSSSDTSTHNPSLQLSIFLRTLSWPLALWGAAVAVVIIAGQPGVVCMTPMAWLLSLLCGRQYIILAGSRRGRSPLLGPALTGAVLGLCMSILFIVVTSFGLGPGEAGNALILDAIISVAGILVCTGLSTIMGWLTLNRYPSVE